MAVRAVVAPKYFADDDILNVTNFFNNLKYGNNARFDSSSVEWSSLVTLSCVRWAGA